MNEVENNEREEERERRLWEERCTAIKVAFGPRAIIQDYDVELIDEEVATAGGMESFIRALMRQEEYRMNQDISIVMGIFREWEEANGPASPIAEAGSTILKELERCKNRVIDRMWKNLAKLKLY
jgi:hypothetical protein